MSEDDKELQMCRNCGAIYLGRWSSDYCEKCWNEIKGPGCDDDDKEETGR